MNCIFCSIVRGEAPASEIYRNSGAVAFMDTSPINPGHVLIVPTEHVTTVSDLKPEGLAEIFGLAGRMAGALRVCGVRAEGINILLSDGEAAGQEVPHTHVHVVPRFKGDGFGFRFGPASSRQATRGDLDRVALGISQALRI